METGSIGTVGGFYTYPADSQAQGNAAGTPARSRQSGAQADGEIPQPGSRSEVARAADKSDPSAAKTKTEEKADKAKSGSKTQSSGGLTPEQQKAVSELSSIDRRVRAHEAAHVAAGAQYVSGAANFEYQTGPDGKRYAVGGEVSIDTSPEKEPEATIAKMQVVQRAALAPADPSAQDRSVAASAAQNEMDARLELARRAVEGAAPKKGNEPSSKTEAGGAADEQKAPGTSKHQPTAYGSASHARATNSLDTYA